MKRILVILLASLMLFSFIACDDNTPVPPAEEEPDTPVNPDTPTPEPVVEDGSEAHPFRIETWSELKNIASLKSAGATTYVMIMNDIEIPADEYIEDPVKDFVISGTEEGIRLTVSNATESNGNLFEIVDDTIIRNITYDMGSQLKAFICSAFGDVTLENIILEGNIEVRSNNETGFVIYGNWYPGYESVADCNITFINCVNKADFIDVMNSYGAPFISFTWNDGTYKTNLVFDGCSNEGDLFYGKWASILIGNAYPGMEPGSVIIRNGFMNTGTVGSFGTTVFCSHNKDVEESVIFEAGCTAEGVDNFEYRADKGLEFTSDGSWNVISTNEDVSNVQLLGLLYVGYYNESGREIMHAANYTFPIASSTQKSGSTFTMSAPESLQVIGSVAYNGEDEECTIVTHEDQQYWYVGPSAEGLESRPGNPASEEGIAGFTRYYLAGYDADGNAIVMVELTPENLPQN